MSALELEPGDAEGLARDVAFCLEVGEYSTAREQLGRLIELLSRCEPRRITSADELDMLPFGSIVRAANGHAFEKSDESWAFQDRAWGEAGNASPERSEDIPLPALLIFSPDWDRP